MMANEKYAPQARYNEKTRRRYVLNLNKNTDGDILEHLEKLPNVQGYLKELIRKELIRADMKRAGE